MNTRYFKLFLNSGNRAALLFHANQYDTNEQWVFTLYEESGSQFIPTTGEIVGLKSTRVEITQAGTVNSSGQVVINVVEELVSAIGRNEFELILNSSHRTANFIVVVKATTVTNRGMISDSDLEAVYTAIGLGVDAQTVSQLVTKTDTLQSGLNTEIQNRSSGDAALGTRIDNIVAQAGTDNTEVVDIRLKADGTTAATAGNAVREQISDLMQDFDVITNNVPITVTYKGKFIATPNVGEVADISSLANYANNKCSVVSCADGDVFTINARSGLSWLKTWMIVASDGTVLKVGPANRTVTDQVITAPANSAYLVIQTLDDIPSIKNRAMFYDVEYASELVQDVNGRFEVFGNLYDNNDLINGVWDQNGVVTEYSGVNMSRFIEVTAGVTYYLNGAFFAICLYDKNRAYLRNIASGGGSYTCESDVKYVRLSITDGNVSANNGQFIVGSSPYLITPTHEELLKLSSLPMVPPAKIDTDNLEIEYKNINNKPLDIQIINLFNPETITPNTYISASNGQVLELNNWFSTDFIDISNCETVTIVEGFIVVFYNSDKSYYGNTSERIEVEIPEGVKYLRTCAQNSKLNSVQVGENVSVSSYVPYPKAVAPDLMIFANQIISEAGSGYIDNYEVKFLLPDTVYLRPNENFSVYYNGAIKNYFALGDRFYVGQAKKTGSTYSAINGAYDYKWEYTPEAGETFDVEFRVIEKATGTVITSKVVHFVTSATKTGKSINAVVIGDSFVDGYNIVPYLVQMMSDGGNTFNSLGVNSTDFQGIKDNGYAGYTYYSVVNASQYPLRMDRPLSDANWDAGWGENEDHGWTTGQTYGDLTPEQRSHGHTKNEFWNPSTNQFDFSYYMSHYYPNDTCDVFISEYGLNDIGWKTTQECISELPNVKGYIDTIIASVKAYNQNTKIVLYMIVPNDDDDNSIGSWWAFSDNARVLFNCQLFNEMLLTNYSNDPNVIIMPSNGNFDNRYGLRTGTYKPVKFDQTIEETHSIDIHPSVIGSKYIADSMANVVYNLLV